ncbi:MAG: CBS domain-containing protein [Ectothiorhodospiraceae bacterium AqS1]|nr:CBS domain-containing protein [Ectothiorhodospiraceae bacterium AqS1]
MPISPRALLERLTKGRSDKPRSLPRDRESLIEILRASGRQRNLIDTDTLTILENAIKGQDIRVRDIMIPRVQMVVVEEDRQPEEFIQELIASGHSRFPVIKEDRHNVRGILLAKDLLAHFAGLTDKSVPFSMTDMMRPAAFIPESKRLYHLLRDFRRSRNHMAIVVNEHEGVAGLVTIEDVLEQIVGEIDDEHDDNEGVLIKEHSDGTFTVEARIPIEDFNEYFSCDLDEEEVDTVGGLVVRAFERLPVKGERAQIGGFQFTVLRADRRRIYLLRGQRLSTSDESGESSADSSQSPP